MNPCAFLLGLILVQLVSGCAKSGTVAKEDKVPDQTIQQVLEKYTDQWMKLPDVVGTGIGECDGKPCIKVFVARKSAKVEKAISAMADGYPVVIENTGEFKALDRD